MHRLRIADLPAHWLFLPPLAFAALNNIALKSETAPGSLFKLATEEVSSVIVIFALVPLLIGLARQWPPAVKLPLLARHLGGSMLFSALHVLGMVTIRHLVFAAAGAEYRPCPLAEMFLYEYGKDVAAYALIIATIGWFDRRFPPVVQTPSIFDRRPSLPLRGGEGLGEVGLAASRRQSPVRNASAFASILTTHPPHLTQPSPPSSRTERASVSFEVKTARGTVIIPAEEILRVEAAGNYATLVTARGAFLHRATMREIETMLPSDRFARAHRSHIVRLDAIAAIRGPDGEREIRLCNDDAVPLSRRHARARAWHVVLHGGSAKASR